MLNVLLSSLLMICGCVFLVLCGSGLFGGCLFCKMLV